MSNLNLIRIASYFSLVHHIDSISLFEAPVTEIKLDHVSDAANACGQNRGDDEINLFKKTNR
jgi:hypothetical protein